MLDDAQAAAATAYNGTRYESLRWDVAIGGPYRSPADAELAFDAADFQAAVNIEVDGKIGPETRNLMVQVIAAALDGQDVGALAVHADHWARALWFPELEDFTGAQPVGPQSHPGGGGGGSNGGGGGGSNGGGGGGSNGGGGGGMAGGGNPMTPTAPGAKKKAGGGALVVGGVLGLALVLLSD